MFRFKRGATFAPTVSYTPQGGVANLLGAVITSSIRTPGGELVSHLTPTIAPNGLSFTLAPQRPTTAWQLGNANWDIKIVIAGVTFYSETTAFSIIEPVTV